MKKILAAVLVAAFALACLPAFSGCSASVSYQLNVDDDGNKYYTVYGTGYNPSLSGELVIPSYYGEEGTDSYAPVTEIAQEAFAGTSFTKVTIPATVTEIGSASFARSYHLTEVVFEEGISLDYIAQGMFGYCSSLVKIEIPYGVSLIKRLAFCGCTLLASVNIPDTVTVIGAEAFESCSALTSVNLPESLTTIGELAFYSSGLTEVVIPANVRDIITVSEDDGEQTSTTYGIGMGAFHSCIDLEKAAVLGKIETVRPGAFGYCTALKEIYLPETVTKIEGPYYTSDGDFYCGHAFHNDGELKDVYFAGTAAQWEAIDIENQSYSNNGASYDNSAVINAEKHYGIVYVG